MKALFLFFLSLSVYANTFELKETGLRFTLDIGPKEISYKSENLEKKFLIKKCNEELVNDLNGELIKKTGKAISEKGLGFVIDEHEIFIAPDTAPGKELMAMDARILLFSIEEFKSCR